MEAKELHKKIIKRLADVAIETNDAIKASQTKPLKKSGVEVKVNYKTKE